MKSYTEDDSVCAAIVRDIRMHCITFDSVHVNTTSFIVTSVYCD